MGRFWRTGPDGKRHLTKAGSAHMYEKWGSTEKYKKDRASRNSARRSAIKSGRVHKGDGKDVHHERGVRDGSHTRVMSASANRAKHEGPRKRGSKRRKKEWGR